MSKSPEIVKKLSAKTLTGKVSARMIPDGQTKVVLFDVVGIASGVKTGQSTYGEYTALLGRFRATSHINVSDAQPVGAQFDSGKLFLPDIAADLIQSAIKPGNNVEFALRVGIKVSDKSATGYEYTVESLIAPTEADPFEKLMKSVKPLAIAPPVTAKGK